MVLLKRKVVICAALFLLANSAFAATLAPDNWSPAKILPDAIMGLPLVKYIPATPNEPAPSSYNFTFRGGIQVDNSQALPASLKFANPNDPKAIAGYMSCTLKLERPALPLTGTITARPTSGSKTTTYSNDAQITVQQISINFDAMYPEKNGGTSTSNQVICMKVGKNKITVGEVKAMLGPRFKIELSAEQVKILAALGDLNKIYGKVSPSDTSAQNAPAVSDAPRTDTNKGANGPAGAAPVEITDETSEGKIVDSQ